MCREKHEAFPQSQIWCLYFLGHERNRNMSFTFPLSQDWKLLRAPSSCSQDFFKSLKLPRCKFPDVLRQKPITWRYWMLIWFTPSSLASWISKNLDFVLPRLQSSLKFVFDSCTSAENISYGRHPESWSKIPRNREYKYTASHGWSLYRLGNLSLKKITPSCQLERL